MARYVLSVNDLAVALESLTYVVITEPGDAVSGKNVGIKCEILKKFGDLTASGHIKFTIEDTSGGPSKKVRTQPYAFRSFLRPPAVR